MRYLLSALIIPLAIACGSEEQAPTEETPQEDTTAAEAEVSTQKLQPIGTLDEDGMPFADETEGILLAALEEKFGERISVSSLYFTGPHPNGLYYLEGRSKDPENFGVVAIPLVVIDGTLYADPNGKGYGCAPPEGGRCIFIRADDGGVEGCECVCADESSECEFIETDDPVLPYVGEFEVEVPSS